MRKATVLGVLALAGTLASPAFAADEFTGFRLQATLGQDQLEGTFTYDPVGGDSINTNRFSYAFGGGWALNKYFAVEANLRGGKEFNQDIFPDFVETLETPPVSGFDEGAVFRVRNDVLGVDVSAIGSLWIGKKFSVYARAGFYAWKAETEYVFGDADADAQDIFPWVRDAADDNGFAPIFGIGLQTVLDGALVRVEYQRTDVDDLTNGPNFAQSDNQIDSLNVSIVWTL